MGTRGTGATFSLGFATTGIDNDVIEARHAARAALRCAVGPVVSSSLRWLLRREEAHVPWQPQVIEHLESRQLLAVDGTAGADVFEVKLATSGGSQSKCSSTVPLPRHSRRRTTSAIYFLDSIIEFPKTFASLCRPVP
jgi:hypothetical protein